MGVINITICLEACSSLPPPGPWSCPWSSRSTHPGVDFERTSLMTCKLPLDAYYCQLFCFHSHHYLELDQWWTHFRVEQMSLTGLWMILTTRQWSHLESNTDLSQYLLLLNMTKRMQQYLSPPFQTIWAEMPLFGVQGVSRLLLGMRWLCSAVWSSLDQAQVHRGWERVSICSRKNFLSPRRSSSSDQRVL